MTSFLTPTELLAGASAVLQGNGYRPVRDSLLRKALGYPRAFEDPYAVVAVVAFDSWREIRDGWLDAQAVLVELLSEHFEEHEAKAWEGYLVLLTRDVPPRSDLLLVANIRSNTAYVRKLVATGEELREMSDIERALRPVLPLQPEATSEEAASALDLLPSAMARQGVPYGAAETALEAFVEQESIAERLHEWLDSS